MIVYHGMPTGLDHLGEAKVFRGRHLMVSYATANASDLERYAGLGADIVLDNGAFSEWKRGLPLDLDGFLAWAERAVELASVTWFVAPDAIDGGEQANDDLLYSVPRHLKPWSVPVWHLHESVDRLKRLCDEYPRVALGSSGEFAHPATESWWRRIAKAWAVVPKTTRIHGLRMASPAIVARCPFASVDSTTAGRHANLGAKYEGPLANCRPETRVRAYAEHLEAASAPLVFDPPGSTKQASMFDRLEVA